MSPAPGELRRYDNACRPADSESFAAALVSLCGCSTASYVAAMLQVPGPAMPVVNLASCWCTRGAPMAILLLGHARCLLGEPVAIFQLP